MTSYVSAQNYYQLLDTLNRWTIAYDYYTDLPPKIEKIHYQYIGDTVINSKTYKDFGYGAILREDTVIKKIFLHKDIYPDFEVILYDFAAEKGDTVSDGLMQYTIDSVSTFRLKNNEIRNIFYYSGGLTYNSFYIEGIGSNVGLIELSEFIGPPKIWLDCFSHNYLPIFGSGCFAVSGDKIFSKSENVSIYPNPTQEQIWVESKSEINYYTITNLNGQIIEKSIFENNKISLTNFEVGYYVVTFYQTDNSILDRKKIIVK